MCLRGLGALIRDPTERALQSNLLLSINHSLTHSEDPGNRRITRTILGNEVPVVDVRLGRRSNVPLENGRASVILFVGNELADGGLTRAVRTEDETDAFHVIKYCLLCAAIEWYMQGKIYLRNH